MKKNLALIINDEIEYPDNYDSTLLSDIDSIPNHFCENLYIGDLLDYLNPKDLEQTLDKIISKAQKNSEIHIKAPDILQLCWYSARLNMPLHKFRYITYATGRFGCYSMDEILLLLSEKKNISIVSATYCNGYEYAITIKTNE